MYASSTRTESATVATTALARKAIGPITGLATDTSIAGSAATTP
jgi:hypothetical protein